MEKLKEVVATMDTTHEKIFKEMALKRLQDLGKRVRGRVDLVEDGRTLEYEASFNLLELDPVGEEIVSQAKQVQRHVALFVRSYWLRDSHISYDVE